MFTIFNEGPRIGKDPLRSHLSMMIFVDISPSFRKGLVFTHTPVEQSFIIDS